MLASSYLLNSFWYLGYALEAWTKFWLFFYFISIHCYSIISSFWKLFWGCFTQCVNYLGGVFIRVYARLLQLQLSLCDPMCCSLPSISIHGILQARILEWVAMPFQGIFPTQGSILCLLVSCFSRLGLYC